MKKVMLIALLGLFSMLFTNNVNAHPIKHNVLLTPNDYAPDVKTSNEVTKKITFINNYAPDVTDFNIISFDNNKLINNTMTSYVKLSQTKFRMELLNNAKKTLVKHNAKHFDKFNIDNYSNFQTMYLPPEHYNTNNKQVAEVIAIIRQNDILHFHINNEGKLFQIFLVN